MRVLAAFSGHDASATIVNDGIIEHYFKEERYSRKKHDSGNDIVFKKLLDSGYISEVDYVIYTDNGSNDTKKKKDNILRSFNPNIKIIEPKGEHHLFHAAGSFYNSGFDKALVIAIDSAGGYLNKETFESESVYVAEYPCKFTPVYKKYWSTNMSTDRIVKDKNGCEFICENLNSGYVNIGNLYNSAALSIGGTIDDCGKAMGLSSYGKPVVGLNLLRKTALENIEYYFTNCPEVLKVLNMNGDERADVIITKDNYRHYANYCYEVQRQCQKHVVNLVGRFVEKTGIRKVCLSGGYAMNIITNSDLVNKYPDVQFYFEPVCDDSGLSVGASMYVYRRISGDVNPRPVTNTFYHGQEYDLLQHKGSTVDIKAIADVLHQNRSVGVFCGLAEAGQRALGNRSILYNPLDPDAREVVNNIKKREWYRPFAAVVLEEDLDLYFENACPSPNMTLCFSVKSDIIPGVTHVDNTCRVQTVTSGHLYDILKEFKNLTGHGILLNTSFNLAGSPLIETPDEALDMLSNSSLDYVWFYETKQLFKSTF